MLVLVPTREDVLAIRSIEDAFDLTTTKPQHWEVALIRAAFAEGLFIIPQHAKDAADDEGISNHDIQRVVRTGTARSKDVDQYGSRQVGINFEGTTSNKRRIRVKVGWDGRHYTATVHTI